MEKTFKRAEDKYVLDYTIYANAESALFYDAAGTEPIAIKDAEYVLNRNPRIYTVANEVVTYYNIGSYSIGEETAVITCGNRTFFIGEEPEEVVG